MTTIKINTTQPYNVYIGAGLVHQAGEYIHTIVGRDDPGAPSNNTHPTNGVPSRHALHTICVVTDTNVNRLHSAALEISLTAAGFRVVKYVTRSGESSKSMINYGCLLDFLVESQVTRTDTILAFGGGVVGDLAGFVAATYLRGVRFVQFATSLLAAVDSSVGGKTGLNLSAGKNLVGAFLQPHVVLCDTDLLFTQPRKRFMDGVAECIKHAIIADPDLFAKLGDKGYIRTNIDSVVARNVQIKADIVSRDELERGERALLNLGHTVGHAIERLSDYKITHGHAVAMGMSVEARAAAGVGVCSPHVSRQIDDILVAHGFDIACPYNAESLATAMLSDKKRSADTITFALPREIGKCCLHKVGVGELAGFVEG